MRPTALNPDEFSRRWTNSVRGDIHRLRAPRDTRGQEQQGARFAVIVQSDDLMLSTMLVTPTSRSASARSFRPTILINDEETQVLIEQTSAVAPERLGDFVGRVTHDELREINNALRLALELD
jgi:mRNA interferase MazF